jgi:hypothetical protein
MRNGVFVAITFVAHFLALRVKNKFAYETTALSVPPFSSSVFVFMEITNEPLELGTLSLVWRQIIIIVTNYFWTIAYR